VRLRHIEIFHAIYTTGSITNAAKILNVSQPSVSKVLSHAEMQLGFNLFSRIKGRLVPTEEADMLFDEVDKIYQQMHTIKNTAANIKKSGHGTIKLGLTPALGFDAIPFAIAQFCQQFPNVELEIETIHNDAVLQSLLEHKCDLAVLFSPSQIAGINALPIAQSELVIVYPKDALSGNPAQVKLSQLSDYEFINIKDSGPLGSMLWNRMLEEGISLTSKIKVQTYFIAARLVAQGVGVCVVDKYTAQGNQADNTTIASFDPPLIFDITTLHLENKPLSTIAKAFVDCLTESIDTV
jgi:DNA-binding transcriptional LysR family regulator